MAESNDWYPTTQEGEREMYAAIVANIDDVDVTLQMEPDKKTRLKSIAQVVVAYLDNLLLNRAAVKAQGTDFKTIMYGKKGEDPMPVAPEYHALTLPAGDFVGLEAEMREMRRYMTGLFTWTAGMGDVLKMNGTNVKPPPPGEKSPAVVLSNIQGNQITARAKKDGEEGIEYQYRVAGANVWQPLLMTGDSEANLEIPVEAGKADKIEIRAIFVTKFKRVGNWSPTYTVSVSG